VESWIVRALAAGGVLFALGWLLVLVSGYGGNSTGGSALVWHIGGVMVYLGVPIVLIGGLVALVVRLRAAICGRRRSRPDVL
jgi:hypothetical protein